MFTAANGDRPQNHNVLFLLTDGHSPDAKAAADAAKAAGIEIIVIAVGHQADTAHLKKLCYNPTTDLHIIDNFSKIKEIFKNRYNCTDSSTEPSNLVAVSPDAIHDMSPPPDVETIPDPGSDISPPNHK